MTTTTLTRSNAAVYIKPFTEVFPPEGVEISETYDYHFSFLEPDGATCTETEKFPFELMPQQVEDMWGYFMMEYDEFEGYQRKQEQIEPLYVTVTYPHCELPTHLFYERGIDEF